MRRRPPSHGNKQINKGSNYEPMIPLPICPQVPPQQLFQTLPIPHPVALHHFFHRPLEILVRVFRLHRQHHAALLEQNLIAVVACCCLGRRLFFSLQNGPGVARRLEEKPLRLGPAEDHFFRGALLLGVLLVSRPGGGAAARGVLRGGVREERLRRVGAGVGVQVEEDRVDGLEDVVSAGPEREGLGLLAQGPLPWMMMPW